MTQKKIEYPWHEIFSLYPYRAEKERSQYFGEVNDLRHSLDTVANEKVLSCEKKEFKFKCNKKLFCLVIFFSTCGF